MASESKPYTIFAFDEHFTAVVDALGNGLVLTGNKVTHYITRQTLQHHLDSLEGGDPGDIQEALRQIKEGEMYQQTIPGYGTFVLVKRDDAIPLAPFIAGSRAVVAGGDQGAVSRAAGIKSDFTDRPEILAGLELVQAQWAAAASGEAPITEITPQDKGRRDGGGKKGRG